MPRFFKREGPYEKLVFLLRGYEFDGPRIAAAIGKAPSTGWSRLKDPGTLTLRELRAISRAGIPIDDLRAAL